MRFTGSSSRQGCAGVAALLAVGAPRAAAGDCVV